MRQRDTNGGKERETHRYSDKEEVRQTGRDTLERKRERERKVRKKRREGDREREREGGGGGGGND